MFRAHAKLNLALAVAPPEPANADRPGWHRIASWFHAIELHDTVRVEPGPPSFEASWAGDPPRPVEWPTERDLAFRASAALRAQLDEPIDAGIEISKRIPAGAGLGGGSSDAAVTLDSLNSMATVPLNTDRLADVAGSIGSDVAFFLGGAPPRPAFVTGFGDTITRSKNVDAGVVLIVPPFGCSTPDVYAAFDELPHRVSFGQDSDRIGAMCGSLDTGGLFNDLEAAACNVEPRLGGLIESLRASLDRPVHMTGSGSSLFILCDRQGTIALADRARGFLGEECRVIETRLV